MAYIKTGTIKDISEIPLDKPLIISGNVNRHSWHWRMEGVFKKETNEIIFENIHGIVTKAKSGEVNLAVLKKAAQKASSKKHLE